MSTWQPYKSCRETLHMWKLRHENTNCTQIKTFFQRISIPDDLHPQEVLMETRHSQSIFFLTFAWGNTVQELKHGCFDWQVGVIWFNPILFLLAGLRLNWLTGASYLHVVTEVRVITFEQLCGNFFFFFTKCLQMRWAAQSLIKLSFLGWYAMELSCIDKKIGGNRSFPQVWIIRSCWALESSSRLSVEIMPKVLWTVGKLSHQSRRWIPATLPKHLVGSINQS